MYEGKNIHYSTDQKPLCSFSGKVCNQRRLNNYGFCVRHILEDASAPFKRCAYVAKSSRQTCTQPIPQNEEREYCNNHMQVLGMLPKKERKPKKEKDRLGLLSAQLHSKGAKADPGLLQNKIKPRLSVGTIKSKLMSNKLSSSAEDMDDVYTFPTDSNEKLKGFTAVISSVTLPDVSVTVSSVNTQHVRTSTDSGQSSLAKIYPELAEKLEKIKPKVEIKTKGKVKSSRTMNSLQTKIAQNKIKDKLKRNHCSSNTSSQSQSPSHSYASSPGYQVNATSPAHSAHSPNSNVPPNVTVGRDGNSIIGAASGAMVNKSATSAVSATSLSHMNILNGLNLQTLNLSLEQLGLPVPTVSDIEQTLKQLASAANISLDGGPTFVSEPERHTIRHGAPVGNGIASGQELHHLLPQTYIPQTKPPPPYSSVHHKPVTVTMNNGIVPFGASTVISQSDGAANQAVQTGHQIKPLNSDTALEVVNTPLISRQYQPAAPPSVAQVVPTTTTSALSSSNFTALSSPSSLSTLAASLPSFSLAASLTSPLLSSPLLSTPFPGQPKLTLLTTSQTLTTSSPVVTDSAKQKLTMASFQQPKARAVKSRPRSRNASSGSKRPAPLFPLPLTVVKPKKIRKLLDKEETNKLKTKSAINFYNRNKQKKIDNHNMICSSIASSDDSDISDCDMLTFQPDWFRASSDEEAGDEESDYGLRTAKLALGRARLRRQCSQARLSSCSGYSKKCMLETTKGLIAACRESPRYTVKCLTEIYHIRSKPPDRLKSKGLVRRRCLYRDNDEVQCTHNVVPYTNHCIKHVMYNVDQQLFEYCTAKFADNTQCCHPVTDVKHELPLCIEHGVKADNFLKTQDMDQKPKKQRKKTKPSALTRPPKKGKKKKNQRKTFNTEKSVVVDSEENEAMDSDNEEESTQPYSGKDTDSLSVKCESQPFSHLQGKPSPEPVCISPVITSHDAALVVRDGIKSFTKPTVAIPQAGMLKPDAGVVKPEVIKPDLSDKKMDVSTEGQDIGGIKTTMVNSAKPEKKTGSVSQLEELENLNALSVLENVRMFGDLETAASKLLEEHDFQDVFSKLPDVTFDIFNNKGLEKMPVNDELPDIEDSLALANRELKIGKETLGPVSTSNSKGIYHNQQQFRTPLLDEADDLTRQIAEEIMKQNIGPSVSMEHSMCNGDAEESIKAIARSLSNSGMMLAAEAKNKTNAQEPVSVSQPGPNLPRTQSLPAYSNLDFQFFPPNVAVQNIPAKVTQNTTGHTQTSGLPKAASSVSQSELYRGLTQTGVVPQNVTITPQGIITSHLNSAKLTPGTQTVTIGNTTVTGNQTAGIITLPVPQQLTAEQLSVLVQQATAHLPPLPPYTPRSQAPMVAVSQAASTLSSRPAVTQNLSIPQQTQGFTLSQMAPSPSSRPVLSQDVLIQQLAKQQEHLGEQQQLLAQQILQQRIAVLTQQALPVNVTLTGSPNLAMPVRLNLPPTQNLGQQSVPVSVTFTSTGSVTQTGVPIRVTLAATQGSTQQNVPIKVTLPSGPLANPQALPVRMTLPSSQNLGFSTILHQGQLGQLGRLNQGVVHTLPNVRHVAQLIKTNLPTSQPQIAPITLPTTNIVWTSPPNVTITSPNGLPRNVVQTFISGNKVTAPSTKIKNSAIVKETFIDLTEDPPPPPPYEATHLSHGKSVPSSPAVLPSSTSTSSQVVAGKS